MLEKRTVLGGTTARSGTWIWIPNHRLMREAGMADPRDAALRYMARLTRPDRYDPDDATLGLPPDEHAMLAAFYDNAAAALDELVDAGAIDPVMLDRAPDYFAELPENAAPHGRVIVSRGRERPDQLTGRELVEDLADTARRHGVRHRARLPGDRRRTRPARSRARRRHGRAGTDRRAARSRVRNRRLHATPRTCSATSSRCRCATAARAPARRATSCASDSGSEPACTT